MTVKQLKNRLENYPDEMEVVIAATTTEFEVTPLESVYQKEISWKDGDPDAETLAKYDCVVLDEEIK